MGKKEFNKILTRFIRSLSAEINYKIKGKTLLYEYCSILRVINFDLGTDGFACDIALLPLYKPNKYIFLSLGNRIGTFAGKYVDRYDYGNSIEEAEANLAIVREQILNYVLKWFEEVGEPSKLAEFLEAKKSRKLIYWCSGWVRLIYKGLSFLKAGDTRKGIKALEQAKEHMKEGKSEWWLDDIKFVNDVLDTAKLGQESIDRMLVEFENYTREQLKI